MVGSKPLKIDTTTTSSTLEKSGKIINQEPPKSPKPKLPNVEDKPKLPVEEKPQEIREIKTPPVIGWKPLQSQSSVTSLSSVNSLTSPVEENKSETKNWKTSNVETKTEKMSLEERVNIFSKIPSNPNVCLILQSNQGIFTRKLSDFKSRIFCQIAIFNCVKKFVKLTRM